MDRRGSRQTWLRAQFVPPVSYPPGADLTGKASNPFVIGPWAITAPSAGGWGVKVDNSSGAITKFFTITGLSANYNDTNPAHPFVWLVGVTNATTISSLSANNDGTGVRLDSSSNTTLDNLSFNLMNGNSVLLNSSSFVSITNSKLKSAGPPQSDMGDQNGFKAVNSSHLTIVSPSNCATTLTCNSFTYDDAMALWLQNTNTVNVDYLTTGAGDTADIILDGPGTFGVTINHSTANSTGAICEMVGTTPMHTGFITDTIGGFVLINGAHENLIENSGAHGNLGPDIASGGTGSWLNPCTGTSVIFNPPTPGMGSGNQFVNDCFVNTNIPNLKPVCP